MMGKSHAQTAGISWVALLATTQHHVGGVTALGVGVSTCAAVAAGVAPDIDHPGSGVTRNLGVVGKLTSRAVRKAAHGHRLLTHTLGASIGAAAVTFLASLYPFTVRLHEHAGDGPVADLLRWLAWIHQGIMAVLLALLVATAIDLLPKVGEAVEWGAAVLAAASTSAIGVDVAWWLLPAAVAWGWHCHLICDRCTMEPIPYGWPFTPERQRTAWMLFKVNTPTERWVVRGVWVAGTLVVLLQATA